MEALTKHLALGRAREQLGVFGRHDVDCRHAGRPKRSPSSSTLSPGQNKVKTATPRQQNQDEAKPRFYTPTRSSPLQNEGYETRAYRPRHHDHLIQQTNTSTKPGNNHPPPAYLRKHSAARLLLPPPHTAPTLPRACAHSCKCGSRTSRAGVPGPPDPTPNPDRRAPPPPILFCGPRRPGTESGGRMRDRSDSGFFLGCRLGWKGDGLGCRFGVFSGQGVVSWSRRLECSLLGGMVVAIRTGWG